MGRGESPIKLSNSWFSAKFIKVKRRFCGVAGTVNSPGRGRPTLPDLGKTHNRLNITARRTPNSKVWGQKGNSPHNWLRFLSVENLWKATEFLCSSGRWASKRQSFKEFVTDRQAIKNFVGAENEMKRNTHRSYY